MAEGVFHTLLGAAVAPSQIENETSAPEVAAWARAINLSRMDCLTLLRHATTAGPCFACVSTSCGWMA